MTAFIRKCAHVNLRTSRLVGAVCQPASVGGEGRAPVPKVRALEQLRFTRLQFLSFALYRHGPEFEPLWTGLIKGQGFAVGREGGRVLKVLILDQILGPAAAIRSRE